MFSPSIILNSKDGFSPSEIWATQDALQPLETVERARVFTKMLLRLKDQNSVAGTLMIDATHLKAHRPASSLGLKKVGHSCEIGRIKGGLNSKPHAVTDAADRPLPMFLIRGQHSDYIYARAILDTLPPTAYLSADRHHYAAWIVKVMKIKGQRPSSNR